MATKVKTSDKKKVKAKGEDAPKKKFPFGRKPGAKGAASSTKKKSKRAPPILFQAPADFKPAFFEVKFTTMRDGLINGNSLKAIRIKGKWDNPDAKRYDLAEYDLGTLLGIAARLGSIYAPNVLKRLPGKTTFKLILRAGKKAADNSLSVKVKEAGHVIFHNDKPKLKWFEDKKDPVYRKLRKVSKVLSAAFTKVQLPPKGRQKKTEE